MVEMKVVAQRLIDKKKESEFSLSFLRARRCPALDRSLAWESGLV
jgi:hypothetical protein